NVLEVLPPEDSRRFTACMALGKILVARGQHQDAIVVFQESGSHPTALLELASAHLLAGKYEEAVTAAEPLLAQEIPQRDLAEVITARSLLLGAKLEESGAVIQTAISRGQPHPLAPRLMATRGLIAYYRGQMDDARKDIESAYQSAHGLQDPENLDLIRATLAMLLHKSGDPSGALTLYEQSLQAARKDHHLPRQVVRLTNLAVFKHETGHFEHAVKLYREAAEIAFAIDGTKEQVRIGVTRGNLLFFLGEIEQAHQLISEATKLAQEQSMHTEWAYLLVLGAEVEVARGNPQITGEALDLAIEKFEAAGNQAGKIEAIGAQTQALLAQNQFEQARELAQQTVQEALEIKRERIAAQAGVWLALAHLPKDSPVESGILEVNKAILLAEKLAEPDILWPLYLVACQLYARRQDTQKAAQLYEKGRAAAGLAFSRISGRFEITYAQVWHRLHLWRYLQGDMDFTPGHSSKTVDRILAINRALSRDHDPERLLDRIIDAAITLSGAERGFIILQDSSSSDGLSMRAARNMEQEAPEGDEQTFSHSIAIKVMEEGNLINTVNAQGDERFSEHRSVHSLNLKSVLCIPLQAPPHTVGALYLDHRHRVNAFSDVDSSMIGAFADQAAIALSNAQLVSNLRNHSEELESTRAEVEELNQRLAQELKAQAAELDAVRKNRTEITSSEPMQHGMIGTSSPMLQVFKIINRVSDKDVPVTILGESGTGKELVARAIHAASPRKGQFVSVNCGAISPGLWESELFGHEKGSFTGAVRAKPGLFEIADKGTLFLDEVGEMPLEVQVKLLRVLQQKELRRVGGTRTLTTDARVICATNRNLEDMVREATFREDLWYRLNVVEVHLAPLRKRKEDTNLLLDHFLAKHGGRTPPAFTRRARAMLLDYAWPGNIRELENEVQRACALAEGDIIPDDLSGKIKKMNPKAQAPMSFGGNLKDQVAQFESSVIRESLVEVDGKVAAAAKNLGLTRAGLYKKINKYDIDVNK
ncbi:MAG: sigma 54-interacting transcriptional regulator, partial [Deltaproteobacteria bacterium]|nr:sigma 54-interacting transcriptional regulator [Deltaproteobacteria bacterium]